MNYGYFDKENNEYVVVTLPETPIILYDPKISFISWSILMVAILPFLQLLTTIFISFINLIRIRQKNSNNV